MAESADCSWRCSSKFWDVRKSYPPGTHSPKTLKEEFDEEDVVISGDVAGLGGMEFLRATVMDPKTSTVTPSFIGAHDRTRRRKYASLVNFELGVLNVQPTNAWEVYSELMERTFEVLFAVACPLPEIYGYKENRETGDTFVELQRSLFPDLVSAEALRSRHVEDAVAYAKANFEAMHLFIGCK